MVHLASPFVLGAWGAATLAAGLGMPTVAVYQTDVAGVRPGVPVGLGRARRPGGGCAAIHDRAAAHPRPVHSEPPPTCSPHGVQRVWLWRRGVDAVRFDPAKR